ncbi:MAG: hypothetical protein AAGC55_08710 [Myxococcota bacterium]
MAADRDKEGEGEGEGDEAVAHGPGDGAVFKDIGPECRWRRAQTLDSSLQLACATGTRAISGACYSETASAPVVRSHIYENGLFSNLPDDNERWDTTDGETGWYCQRDGTHPQWELIAVTLCCGSAL